MDGWMEGRKDGGMHGWRDRGMEVWTIGMDSWLAGWVGE